MRRRERLFKKAMKSKMLKLKRAHRRGAPSSRWMETWVEKNADGSWSICLGQSRAAKAWSDAFMVTSRATNWPPWLQRARAKTLAEEVDSWR